MIAILQDKVHLGGLIGYLTTYLLNVIDAWGAQMARTALIIMTLQQPLVRHSEQEAETTNNTGIDKRRIKHAFLGLLEARPYTFPIEAIVMDKGSIAPFF